MRNGAAQVDAVLTHNAQHTAMIKQWETNMAPIPPPPGPRLPNPGTYEERDPR